MKRKSKNTWANRLAVIGITIVVGFLAIAVHIRSTELHTKMRDYQAEEESLDAAIADENQYHKELEEKKVYVKTKEFTIERAREIYGLKMPDEIIVRPENK